MRKPVFVFIATGLILSLSSMAGAALSTIGFTPAEGYESGGLAGQPSGGSDAWQVEGDSDQMRVVSMSRIGGDGLFLRAGLGGTDSDSDHDAVAVKSFDEVTGLFEASYDIYMTSSAGGSNDRSSIGLADNLGNMGVWLGANANSSTSLAYNDGADWVTVCENFAVSTWYTVRVSGDVASGRFDLSVHEAGQLPSLVDLSGLAFSGSVGSLSSVRISNEDASVASSTYHYIDNLTVSAVPVPGTLLMMISGVTALMGMRRKSA